MSPRFALFYKPPCGVWYIHSHKLYPTEAAAEDAARKFLTPGTPIAVLPFSAGRLDKVAKVVQ